MRFRLLSDVLLFPVLHDDDGARQWDRVLRPRGADDDSEGEHRSYNRNEGPVCQLVAPG